MIWLGQIIWFTTVKKKEKQVELTTIQSAGTCSISKNCKNTGVTEDLKQNVWDAIN